MKTTNPVLDTIIESQTQIINNWMDSAKKMQSALAKGNIASDGQQLYKEYFDKQMDILNSMKNSAGSMFGQSENNPQDFFQELVQPAGHLCQADGRFQPEHSEQLQ
jgi:predicted component of type VI protein secretion system